MRVIDLPLDTWVVVEATAAADEVELMSTHATQHQAEAERDKRNQGLRAPRYRAVRALNPTAGALACAAVVTHK
jgi:hypothetical protein